MALKKDFSWVLLRILNKSTGTLPAIIITNTKKMSK